MYDSLFATASDCRLNHRVMGAGRNVVLIHGLAANLGFWPLELLLALSRGFRVIVYDLRGHGYSDMPASGYTPADMVLDLDGLINRLMLDKVHLIGHSFGGVVALNYAAMYPERVASATVLDTRLRSLQPTNRAPDWLKWKEAAPVLEALGLSIPADENEFGLWLLEQMALPRWREARRKLAESPLAIPFVRLGKSSRFAEKWLELLNATTARQDFMADDGLTPAVLASIPQPVLAMYGEYSPALPSLEGLRQRVRRLSACMLPRAGHFFPQTHPRPLYAQVARFLDRLDAGDQRKHDRYPLNLGVQLRASGGADLPAEVLNGSLRGVLLNCPRDIVIHSEVELFGFQWPEQLKWRLKGKVVRAVAGNGNGNCLAGVELAPEGEDFARWREFLGTRDEEAGPVLPL